MLEEKLRAAKIALATAHRTMIEVSKELGPNVNYDLDLSIASAHLAIVHLAKSRGQIPDDRPVGPT